MPACDRCGEETSSTIMSMYDTTEICDSCKREERKRPDYAKAEARDLNSYADRLAAYGMPRQAQSVRDQADRILRTASAAAR